MIQHPAILALTAASIIICAMIFYASWFGNRIIESWNLQNGDEKQLELERRTYLISVILSYALVFQILSLFLYIFTADALHTQFTGAMCAAGSLAVNSYGYPVLILKIVNCLIAGVWLILNHVDTTGYDYPLIKPKYHLLAILSPLLLLEAVFQFVYFFNLKADVITSCCGSLFSASKRSIAGEMANLPVEFMQWLFFCSMALTAISGIYFIKKQKFALIFSIISSTTFFIAATSLVTFISLYIYELPTHHCPFCILQKEYNYIGYLFHGLLLLMGITGAGTGAVEAFRKTRSLYKTIPSIQKKLAIICMVSALIFTLITVWEMLSTSFVMG